MMTITARFRDYGLSVLVLLLVGTPSTWATQPDYVEDETTAVDSAKEIKGLLIPDVEPAGRRQYRFRRLREYLDGLPPFFSNSTLTLRPRLYNFDRDRTDRTDQVSFAVGGSLRYRSGLLREHLSVGLTAYTTQKIHGPHDAGGIGLLRPVQAGFGVLGEAHAKLDFQPYAEVKLYRQSMGLPYVNRQDSRMIPRTHEAYMIRQTAARRVQWVAGHVTHMKSRNSDEFVPLSEAAGFAGTNKGASIGGARWNFDDDSNIGIVSYRAWDFMNITYAEGNTVIDLADAIPLVIGVQATYQASIGDELGGDFGTYTVGARAVVSYKNAVLSLAGTYTDEDSAIRSPFGGRPSYLSLMIADFDRAGEGAWLAGLSFNFSRLGVDGLGFKVKYARGYGHGPDPDRDEFDLTLDYRPEHTFLQQWTLLRGFWARFRYGTLDEDHTRRIDDLRFIVNYEVPLL